MQITMKKIISLIIFLLPVVSQAQTSYLCLPSAATGFSYDATKNSWVVTRFNIDDEKKILKRAQGGWERINFGETSGRKCPEFNEAHQLRCNTIFGSLQINKKTMRYIATYEAGYIDGVRSNDNTPSMTIGTCTPISN